MKLVVTSFLTVDGVFEAPGGEEHRDGKNAWALRAQDEELQQFNRQVVFEADALLFGRKTYQIWAAFWPTATADAELASRVNSLPKYVVSKTLKEPDWENTIILGGDLTAQIARLKEEPGGNLLVYGSSDLVSLLIEEQLVDEYRLMVFPVILGSGKHLFRDGLDLSHLRLVDSRTFSAGVVLLVYQPATAEPTGPYVEPYLWTQEQVRSLQAAENVDRILATVLFTDLVESTARAAELGDRAWRQLLDRHDARVQAEVGRWRGELIKNTGDGILAIFDTPTRALRCAFGLHQEMARLGLELRSAIHTGEVERREDDLAGIGVHIAARALGEARPGQVVVTRTVRDLASGTDLAFSPLGAISLRGVPGQWELFEAGLA
jgi:class 3 adenylate cyclase/dihydrofolate reductase